MSGIGGIVIGAVGATFTWGAAPWVFWSVGVVLLLAACYRTWHGEHLEKTKAVAEREQAVADLAAEKKAREVERLQACDRLAAELNRLIGTGTAIQAKLLAGGGGTEAAAWEQEAGAFVDAQLPAYSAHFRSDAGITSQGHPGDPAARALVHLDRRLTRLGEILHKVSGKK